jgi:hypothetical protein
MLMSMPRLLLPVLVSLLAGLAPAAAPPFPSADPRDWIGAPASWEALRGKVVLLHVWTFG